MPSINLLPWREERRLQREKQFKTALVGFAIFAILVAGYWYNSVGSDITFQKKRNDYLQKEISKLDKRIESIKKLKKKKRELLARRKIIKQLQQSRPQIVHLFDQLVRTLPDGVYLKSLKQSGKKIHLIGVATSNARISTYMRQISDSPWLENPNLQIIKSDNNKTQRRKAFTLTATLTTPSKDKKS